MNPRLAKVLRSPRSAWNLMRLRWAQAQAVRDRSKIGRSGPIAEAELDRIHWSESLSNPTRFYEKCHCFYQHNLPADLRAHRDYFTVCSRGFGEDAFHVLWFLLFREIRPRSFLEIGVYRGQTISLIALLARQQNHECSITGISPFSSVGDSVSTYLKTIDYEADTLANFAHFNLPQPRLHRSLSSDESAKALIKSQPWDMVYIDGNHDYDVVAADWELCSQQVQPGGVIVLDDSGLNTTYQAPRFATKGHPGPSQLAAEIDRTRFKEILQVGHNRAFMALKP